MNLLQEDCSYLTFCDLLTGYRLSSVLMLAHDFGVFDAIGQEGSEGPDLCLRFGWDPNYGGRFLRCLCGLGLLRQLGDRYFLSRFAATYLCAESAQYQGKTLTFEKQLCHSWEQLAVTLGAGKRVFATKDKDPQELAQALTTYLGSMDEAAGIRAEELCDCFPPLESSGSILDIGSGSGAFLYAFLKRFPKWHGIFCDLPEVVAGKELHRRVAEFDHRLSWCGCNLLADGSSDFDLICEQSCDIALLSNVVHCQGTAETEILLRKAIAKTREQGVLVVHDYFSDTGWRGSLYDIHMMLNTFNGKAHSLQEIIRMALPYGFRHTCSHQLRSGSTVLLLAKNRESLSFIAPGQQKNNISRDIVSEPDAPVFLKEI